MDRERRFVDANPAFCRMLGYTLSELKARTSLDISHPDHREIDDRNTEKLWRGDIDQYRTEKRYMAKDGEVIWVSIFRRLLREFEAPPRLTLALIVDITDRKRAEEALRLSEERYRTVVEDQIEVISRFRADGTITFVNDVYLKFFWKTRGELMGRRWEPVAHAEDLPRIEAELGKLSPEHPVAVIENRVHAGDGSVHWMQFVNRGFFDSQRRLVEIQSVGRDITDRKRAEESHRESEEKFRSILDNSLAGILLTVPNGQILNANPAACRMFGRTEEEICRFGRSLIIDLDDPRAALAVAERERTGRFHGELTGMRADGTKFPIEVSSTIFRDGRGELRTSMLIRDISERKCAEEAVGRASAYARSLIEASLDPLVTIGPDGKITDVNAATEAATGLARDALVGTDFASYFNEPDRARAGYLTVFKDGQVRDFALGLRRSDGTTIPVLYNASVYRDGTGAVLGVFAAARDITARVRGERELRESQEQLRALSAKLESVREEEKGKIAREIHDEFGQRLTGLVIDLSLLNKKIPIERKSLRARVEAMAEEAHDLVSTVRRIATDLRPGILDDLGLIEALEWQAGEFQSRTGIRCGFESRVTAADIEPRHAIGVFRIFQETLTNVVRHAGARRVVIQLRREAEAIVLEVEDDGRGITPAESADPLSLGLAGMRERARLMNGSMEIRGTPGRGTMARLRFPAKLESPTKS